MNQMELLKILEEEEPPPSLGEDVEVTPEMAEDVLEAVLVDMYYAQWEAQRIVRHFREKLFLTVSSVQGEERLRNMVPKQ